MKMTKEMFKRFKQDLMEAIDKAYLKEQYGVDIDTAGLTYDEYGFVLRLNVRNKNSQQEEFNKYAKYINLLPEDYSKTFEYDNDIYKIIGLKIGNKYNVIAENSKGEKAAFKSNDVKKLLEMGSR